LFAVSSAHVVNFPLTLSRSHLKNQFVSTLFDIYRLGGDYHQLKTSGSATGDLLGTQKQQILTRLWRAQRNSYLLLSIIVVWYVMRDSFPLLLVSLNHRCVFSNGRPLNNRHVQQLLASLNIVVW
jgi:hypothetical protein